jgi:hypothetical protein
MKAALTGDSSRRGPMRLAWGLRPRNSAWGQSARRATTGSTRVARRAGSATAAIATVPRPPAALTSAASRYAVRGLWASRGFTLAVVITLGLGIGVNTAIFSMLDAVVLRKLPVPDAHELVGLYENAPRVTPDIVSGTDRYTRFSYARFLRLQQALGTYGSLAAMTAPNGFPARLHNGQRISVSVQLVSGNYFETASRKYR